MSIEKTGRREMARRITLMCLLMSMIILLFPLALAESGNLHRLNRHVPPFNICSVNKFNILRPCADEEICYLFLKRDGMYSPNWMPAWVKVSQNNVLSRFGYGKFLPNHKWCGSSRCPRVSSGSTNATDFATRDVYRCFPQKM